MLVLCWYYSYDFLQTTCIFLKLRTARKAFRGIKQHTENLEPREKKKSLGLWFSFHRTPPALLSPYLCCLNSRDKIKTCSSSLKPQVISGLRLVLQGSLWADHDFDETISIMFWPECNPEEFYHWFQQSQDFMQWVAVT